MRCLPLISRAVMVGALAVGVTWVGGCSEGTTHLRVLTTHDVHGAITPMTYSWSEDRLVGGLAWVKTVMDGAEAECACPTIRLDGGDQMQGTLESNLVYGASSVRAFNLLGIHAAAIGNHELDWGVDTLAARQAEADYQWLAANVFERSTGLRPTWAQPHAMVEVEGVRVGIVGYMTSTTPDVVLSEVSAPYEFRRGASGVAEALQDVRAQDPDFVILVAHAGGGCEDGDCDGELVELAQELDYGVFDLMIGGHIHWSGYGVVNGIPIVRAGSGGRAVGVVDLERVGAAPSSHTFRADTVFVDRVDPDSSIAQAMRPFQLQADLLSADTVLTLDQAFYRDRGEYPLGRLMADAVRAAAGAQVSLSNRGGIRADLPLGAVNYGDLFRTKPFGNVVYRLRVSGSVIRQVVEHALRDAGPDFVSGLRARYAPDRPEGERVVEIRLDGGGVLEDEAEYTLATSNFIAGGGDGYSMLSSFDPEWVGTTTLDALITHLQSLESPQASVLEPRYQPVASGG